MIKAAVNAGQLKQLKAALEGTKKKLPQQISIAINATAKKISSEVSKEVRKELAVSKKAVDKTIGIKSKATPGKLGSTVQVKKSNRISLKEFGARQNKKGVSYKISKTKGRKTVDSAFQGPKPGVMKASWRGTVFKRVGPSRLPIVKLQGPSPWGIVVKNNMSPALEALAKAELKKQIERRIRYLTMTKEGTI